MAIENLLIDSRFSSNEERKFVEGEEIRAFFNETNDQNFAGLIVLSLVVYVTHEGHSAWIWAPGLCALYLVSALRAWIIHLYHLNPAGRSVRQWGLWQTITGGISGICWATVCTALLANVSIELQLFILTVLTVAAATNASEGFAFPQPSTAFIIISITPVIVWLLTVADQLHFILAVMLAIFLPLTIGQSRKRHKVFVESQQLRFRNEILANDLQIQKEAAENSSKAKARFLANMSHELRSPINGILGSIGLATKRMEDPKGLDQLNMAKVSANHLLNVINDILDLSKIDAERMELESIYLQLDHVVDNVNSVLAATASEKGVALNIDLAESLIGLPLIGDPLHLSQVLINLMGNAIKFTGQGGVILRARPISETEKMVEVRIEIIDTGIGMDKEVMSRLFSAFEQADSSMTRKYGGSGLGLAISKRLINLMGGEIGVTSISGVGSTFWITIPLLKHIDGSAPPATILEEDNSELLLRQAHEGAHILVVEDEPINREVIKEILCSSGLRVDLAEDGRHAITLASRARYALILMDMQMPNLNGVDATRAIRKLPDYERTPILAVTANAFDEDRHICIEAGMNDHISKPVDPGKLFKILLKWLSVSTGKDAGQLTG